MSSGFKLMIDLKYYWVLGLTGSNKRRAMFIYFEERITDSGEALHSHGQSEVGGGCDGDLTDGQQEGEHLGVPVISPHPQQTFMVRTWQVQDN